MEYLPVIIAVYALCVYASIMFELSEKYYKTEYLSGARFFTWKDLLMAAVRGFLWPVVRIMYITKLMKRDNKDKTKPPLAHRIAMQIIRRII